MSVFSRGQTDEASRPIDADARGEEQTDRDL